MTNPSAARISTLKMAIPYHKDPTQVFELLCLDKQDSLLLESAEIDSKDNLKSIMIIDSALKITLISKNLCIEAKSKNALVMLDFIRKNYPKELNLLSSSENKLNFEIPLQDQHLDEDTRIKSVSVFDIFRLIQTFDKVDINNPNAIFLGGLFAYDLIYQYESLPEVVNETNCPDLCFYLAETMMFIDHQTQQSHLQATLFSDSPAERNSLLNRLNILHSQLDQKIPIFLKNKVIIEDFHKLNINNVNVNFDDSTYCDQVSSLKNNILAGDIFQVVPSRRFSLACPKPLSAYQVLKKQNPSPYMFYMQDETFTLFGASPESALKYDSKSRQIEIYPIAGTRPRGKNPDGSINFDLDSRLEYEVRNDKKELAEHTMLVDLARNDLSRVCEPGSRYVADLTKVDRYSVVMHLVSRVVGTLRKDLDVLHAYFACMNMGTLTGAPKVKAMSLIAQTEKTKRGSYGGAIGYLNHQGCFDTCIVIRSAYVENDIAHVQAGAGVVLNSVPQLEADESRAKASAVINAIIKAHSQGA
ncbi:anthranilate synthase component 1 [Thorsellia kenyensis]|uniref:Anthranilate synthase component 1 n=1 Tax=Thorsellia kenyensis TaxID=1549888 RepID=A0ABV6CAC9_9GAMM